MRRTTTLAAAALVAASLALTGPAAEAGPKPAKHFKNCDAMHRVYPHGVGKPGAKEALLDYNVTGHADGLSRVQIELHTGRPHQIRVQFAAIGCPLVGDQRYSGQHAAPGQQIALWSTELGFAHPVTKEELRFTSAPPRSYPWILWDEAHMPNGIL